MVLLFLFSVCATSLYTLRCNPRKAGYGKGEGLEDSGCLRLKSVFFDCMSKKRLFFLQKCK